MSDLKGSWGEAVDINDEGQLLIVAHDQRDASSFLWHDDTLIDIGRPDDTCQSFWSLKFTLSGSILGITIGNDQHHGSAIRHENGTWDRILLNTQFHVTCGTNEMLVGYELVNGFHLPWAWIKGEPEPKYLPHFLYHHFKPTAIGSQGWIVGSATSDHCSHPILWKPV